MEKMENLKGILKGDAYASYKDTDLAVWLQDNSKYTITFQDEMICVSDLSVDDLNRFFIEI